MSINNPEMILYALRDDLNWFISDSPFPWLKEKKAHFFKLTFHSLCLKEIQRGRKDQQQQQQAFQFTKHCSTSWRKLIPAKQEKKLSLPLYRLSPPPSSIVSLTLSDWHTRRRRKRHQMVCVFGRSLSTDHRYPILLGLHSPAACTSYLLTGKRRKRMRGW